MPEAKLTGDESMATTPAQVKASVAFALISALDKECETYCLLSGYDRLPNSFDTDIDFMVGRHDFKRMPLIIEKIALQTNTRLFQSVSHELTAHAFLLVSLSGADMTIAQLDAASDYRHFGSLWLRASEVLASRRVHPRGFWIPSADNEFGYCLIKRLNKRSLGPTYASRLHSLYIEDPHACERMIGRFWKGQQAKAINRMAAANDWKEMSICLESYREQLMRNTAESILQRGVSSLKGALHFLGRVAQPTGAWIAFIGPDGSGKSLVISRVGEQFEPAFRGVQCFHMRPKFLSGGPKTGAPVTDPHGQPPRGYFASIVKLLYYAMDYLLGYVFHIFPALIRTRLILFDRYIYDFLVDTKRVRYGGPSWLLKVAARIVLCPNLVILLDAPAEVLWRRKREVSLDEVERQRIAYLNVAHTLPRAIVINGAQPIADVAHDVAEAILDHFARRTARRLGLGVRMSQDSGSQLDAEGER